MRNRAIFCTEKSIFARNKEWIKFTNNVLVLFIFHSRVYIYLYLNMCTDIFLIFGVSLYSLSHNRNTFSTRSYYHILSPKSEGSASEIGTDPSFFLKTDGVTWYWKSMIFTTVARTSLYVLLCIFWIELLWRQCRRHLNVRKRTKTFLHYSGRFMVTFKKNSSFGIYEKWKENKNSDVLNFWFLPLLQYQRK